MLISFDLYTCVYYSIMTTRETLKYLCYEPRNSNAVLRPLISYICHTSLCTGHQVSLVLHNRNGILLDWSGLCIVGHLQENQTTVITFALKCYIDRGIYHIYLCISWPPILEPKLSFSHFWVRISFKNLSFILEASFSYAMVTLNIRTELFFISVFDPFSGCKRSTHTLVNTVRW